MRRAITAVMGLTLMTSTWAAAQDVVEIPTDEWCRTFYALARTSGTDSEQAMVDAYDAVTEEEVLGCQHALRIMEEDGVRPASGLAEQGADPTESPIPDGTSTAPPVE